ncbi:MAG: multiheme c-type cytochrome, partial [Porticoccaceae bacterium]
MYRNPWSYSVIAARLLLVGYIIAGTTQAESQYVGAATCKNCHTDEYQQWQGSHHDWAMREANADTVLGNFDNTQFSHQGITTHFTTANGEYFARTQNKNGNQQTFKIAYTFGFEPLQQYLIG